MGFVLIRSVLCNEENESRYKPQPLRRDWVSPEGFCKVLFLVICVSEGSLRTVSSLATQAQANMHGNKSKHEIISLIRTEAYLSYTQHCFFHSWPVSSSSQCCLSQLTHQILHPHIGRARKQQSVPIILTETVDLFIK